MTINRRSHLANAKILKGQSIIQTELFESPINRGANQQVNRLKNIKRQMYGWASFKLYPSRSVMGVHGGTTYCFEIQSQ